ncbi:MAG: hypothetical protein KDI19_05235 [Pseudomonadales bacterium]|nr:hypothetical protein [Pseudomonadales bacterium]
MLVGTASVEALAASAPTISAWREQAVELRGVTCLQVTAEMRRAAREAVLPPALHPTIPAAISIQAWRVRDGDLGAFDFVCCRVSCRSGVRARGFTTGACASTERASSGLAGIFGFPTRTATIDFRQGYDGADLRVEVKGKTILALGATSPEPMGPDDVQYTSTLNLAHTPNGLRLVQVEAHHLASKIDRLTAHLDSFDGEAFGDARLRPYHVVSASIASEDISLPGVRFVCRPDELAFTGTEPVSRA